MGRKKVLMRAVLITYEAPVLGNDANYSTVIKGLIKNKHGPVRRRARRSHPELLQAV